MLRRPYSCIFFVARVAKKLLALFRSVAVVFVVATNMISLAETRVPSRADALRKFFAPITELCIRTESAQSCPQDIATQTWRAKRVRAVTAPPRAEPRPACHVMRVRKTSAHTQSVHYRCYGRDSRHTAIEMARTLSVDGSGGCGCCAFSLTCAHTKLAARPCWVSAFASRSVKETHKCARPFRFGRCWAIVRRTRISGERAEHYPDG